MYVRDTQCCKSNGLASCSAIIIYIVYVYILLQFIALGTFDGTIKLLDHTGTFLKDRDYTVVRYIHTCICIIILILHLSVSESLRNVRAGGHGKPFDPS